MQRHLVVMFIQDNSTAFSCISSETVTVVPVRFDPFWRVIYLFFVNCAPAVVCAVEALAALVVGKSLQEIVSDFRGFYRLLTSDGQMRWVRTIPTVSLENNLL